MSRTKQPICYYPFDNPTKIWPYSTSAKKKLIEITLYNQDVVLLERRYALNIPKKIEFGGKLSWQTYTSLTENKLASLQSDLNDTELDFVSYINHSLLLFMDLSHTNLPVNVSGNIANTTIYLDRIFITWGDLSRSPLYVTIGRRYLPFGAYDNFMITGPPAEIIAETEAFSLLIGHESPTQNKLYSSVYAFQGVKKLLWDTSEKIIPGFTIGYKFAIDDFNLNTGFDYIQSITFAERLPTWVNHYNKVIPGIDWHTAINIKKFSLLGECTATTKHLTNRFHQHANPIIINLEAGYNMHVLNYPSLIAISYSKTLKSGLLYLPAQTMNAEFSMSFYDHLTIGIQYQHNIDYPATMKSITDSPPALAKNVFFARALFYF